MTRVGNSKVKFLIRSVSPVSMNSSMSALTIGRTISGSQRTNDFDLNAAETRLRCSRCVVPPIARMVGPMNSADGRVVHRRVEQLAVPEHRVDRVERHRGVVLLGPQVLRRLGVVHDRAAEHPGLVALGREERVRVPDQPGCARPPDGLYFGFHGTSSRIRASRTAMLQRSYCKDYSIVPVRLTEDHYDEAGEHYRRARRNRRAAPRRTARDPGSAAAGVRRRRAAERRVSDATASTGCWPWCSTTPTPSSTRWPPTSAPGPVPASLFTEVVGMIPVIEHTRSHVAEWMRPHQHHARGPALRAAGRSRVDAAGRRRNHRPVELPAQPRRAARRRRRSPRAIA